MQVTGEKEVGRWVWSELWRVVRSSRGYLQHTSSQSSLLRVFTCGESRSTSAVWGWSCQNRIKKNPGQSHNTRQQKSSNLNLVQSRSSFSYLKLAAAGQLISQQQIYRIIYKNPGVFYIHEQFLHTLSEVNGQCSVKHSRSNTSDKVCGITFARAQVCWYQFCDFSAKPRERVEFCFLGQHSPPYLPE